MTTYTRTLDLPQRRGSPVPALFVFILLVVLATLAMQAPSVKTREVLYPPGLPPIHLNPDGHPQVSHSLAEVQITRNCLDQNGPTLIWREKPHGLERFHLLCKSPQSGRWYDMIVQKVNDKWVEITSFPVKDGTTNLGVVTSWLARKGATAWKQPLP
jgi:hypothetical protein